MGKNQEAKETILSILFFFILFILVSSSSNCPRPRCIMRIEDHDLVEHPSLWSKLLSKLNGMAFLISRYFQHLPGDKSPFGHSVLGTLHISKQMCRISNFFPISVLSGFMLSRPPLSHTVKSPDVWQRSRLTSEMKSPL